MISDYIFTSTNNHTLSDKLILNSNNLSYTATAQLNRQMDDESNINKSKALEISNNLQMQLNRITKLASQSPNLYTQKIMSFLTTKLKLINRSSDAKSFLAQMSNKKRGRQIGVQSRRKVGQKNVEHKECNLIIQLKIQLKR